jgi:hypothetical protein
MKHRTNIVKSEYWPVSQSPPIRAKCLRMNKVRRNPGPKASEPGTPFGKRLEHAVLLRYRSRNAFAVAHGFTASNLSDWIGGKTEPTKDNLEALADASWRKAARGIRKHDASWSQASE